MRWSPDGVRTEWYVSRIAPGQWSDPTPCSEWDVRQIVNYLVSENLGAVGLFNGKAIEEVGDRLDGDLVQDDPSDAYGRFVMAAKTALQALGAMEAVCHISPGDVPGSEYATELFIDTLIHSWDFAKATSQDTTLPPELVSACFPLAVNLRARIVGGGGRFGPEVPARPDADLQIRMLSLLGRRACP